MFLEETMTPSFLMPIAPSRKVLLSIFLSLDFNLIAIEAASASIFLSDAMFRL